MKKTAKGIAVHESAENFDEDGFQYYDNDTRRDCRVWPWELPQNWRTGENYPDHKTASRNRWAWEFLRRNEDFQKELAAVDLQGKDFNQKMEANKFPTLEDENAHPVRSAKAILFARWSIKRETHGSLFDSIDAPGAPDCPVTFISSWVNPVTIPWTFSGEITNSGTPEKFFIYPYDSATALIPFNLNWPIEPQILAAKRYLNANRRESKAPRSHVSKYSTYLRIWDAKKEGVTDIKIYLAMGADLSCANSNYEKTIENAQNAAHQLINVGGYVMIALGSATKKVSKKI